MPIINRFDFATDLGDNRQRRDITPSSEEDHKDEEQEGLTCHQVEVAEFQQAQ